MDADDLVITLKKCLAKLSRTERRKAVELVGDVVRAAMFDDAAGDDYEIERCPRCGSTAVVKKGKSKNGDRRYLCRGCGRTFSGSTGRVLGRSRLPRETWMAYAECFALMLPLRECAARCGVCLKTAWTMRLRLIECLKAYSRISASGGAAPASSTRRTSPSPSRATTPGAPSRCRGRPAIAAGRSTGAASPASRSAS